MARQQRHRRIMGILLPPKLWPRIEKNRGEKNSGEKKTTLSGSMNDIKQPFTSMIDAKLIFW